MSVTLYNVNNWIISINSDIPKPIKNVFFASSNVLLISGHKKPSGIKRKIFNMKLKLNPSLKGIKFIFGLNKDSPNCDSLINSLSAGIPTIWVNITHK